MTCSPGELAPIPFPFSDLMSEKRRPLLVLTPVDRHGDFVALAITSIPTESDAIPLTDNLLAEGSLPKRSWVRLNKIYTLDHNLIIKKFGRLNEPALRRVVGALCQVAGHAP